MKVYFLLLTVFFTSHIFAQSTLEVTTLDGERNCWFRHFEETNTYQIADFAGFIPQAHRLDQYQFSEMIQTAIKTVSEKNGYLIDLKGEYEAYLHCSSQGHLFLVNAYDSEPRISFTGNLSDLEKGTISMVAESEKSGFYLGATPHTLLIKHNGKISDIDFKNLVLAALPNTFAAIRFIPGTKLGKLRVTPEYYFDLIKIKALIEEAPTLSPYTEYIELNSMQGYVGEHTLMFKNSFEAK